LDLDNNKLESLPESFDMAIKHIGNLPFFFYAK